MRKFSGYFKTIATTAPEPGHTPSPQIINLNRRLALLTRSSRYEDALHLFDEIHSRLKPDPYTLSTALTACTSLRCVLSGAQLHAHAVKSGLLAYPHVANSLLSLYARAPDVGLVKLLFEEIREPDVYSYTTVLSACARMDDLGYAFGVFGGMPRREVEVWNAMVTGCVESGNEEVAFGLFRDMCRLGVRHDNYTFAGVLGACSLELVEFGKQVHLLVVKTGFLATTSVANALITMYFKSEDVALANLVFNEVGDSMHNQITYNVMIDGLAGSGRPEEMWIFFREMLRGAVRPNGPSFVSLLSSCLDLPLGSQLHSLAIKMGFEASTFVCNASVTMYSNCGDFRAAYMVFDRLGKKDLVSWNAIISSCAQAFLGNSAVLMFREMRRAMIQPDDFTFGSLLVSLVSPKMVEMIHAVIFRFGLNANLHIANSLVTAYSKNGMMKEALMTFCSMTNKNLITWNALISGFVLNGLLVEGMNRFSELLMSELRPNEYTLNMALSICSATSALRLGKQVHGYILISGFGLNLQLGNALITMYTKCGNLDWSLRIFNTMTERDIISWNALISAFSQHGQGLEAVRCFEAMITSSTVKPDNVTFTAVLSACSHSGLIEEGKRIFESMCDCYGVKPEIGQISTIVDLLGRAGLFDEVERIMKSDQFLAHPDIWWILLSACAAHGNLKLGRLAAGHLLEEDKDNPSVYVLLSNAYAAAGQWAEAARARHSIDNMKVTKQPGYSWIST